MLSTRSHNPGNLNAPGENTLSMTIIDRFHSQRRATLQAAADAGRLNQVDELALLEPEQMLPMASLSLKLFAWGGIFFIVLNLLSYIWRTGQYGASLNGGVIFLWFLINIVSYFVILPIHELIHGAAFALWGGKPYFGTKLPLALYCSAKDQVFPRNYYLVIGLAPLAVITLAGIIFTLLAPTLSPYVLFAIVGNLSGASGDLWVVKRLRTLPAETLIEDLETGYRAWQVTPAADSVTIDPV
jgi:hypothetical protein